MVDTIFSTKKEYNAKTPTSTKLICKKRYPKFNDLRTIYQGTNFYERFELRFTGDGLPSLAWRARVPVDSATLPKSTLKNVF